MEKSMEKSLEEKSLDHDDGVEECLKEFKGRVRQHVEAKVEEYCVGKLFGKWRLEEISESKEKQLKAKEEELKAKERKLKARERNLREKNLKAKEMEFKAKERKLKARERNLKAKEEKFKATKMQGLGLGVEFEQLHPHPAFFYSNPPLPRPYVVVVRTPPQRPTK